MLDVLEYYTESTAARDHGDKFMTLQDKKEGGLSFLLSVGSLEQAPVLTSKYNPVTCRQFTQVLEPALPPPPPVVERPAFTMSEKTKVIWTHYHAHAAAHRPAPR